MFSKNEAVGSLHSDSAKTLHYLSKSGIFDLDPRSKKELEEIANTPKEDRTSEMNEKLISLVGELRKIDITQKLISDIDTSNNKSNLK